MDTAENKTALQVEQACLEEINKVLQTYNCRLEVKFKPSTALGQDVLIYQPVVVSNQSAE